MKVSGANLIVRALKAEGVDTVFAVAGDHTLPLMDHMLEEGFRFIDTRHEQGAVDMANAWGQVTGSPGITMFTTPGHVNAIPGLSLASHKESPIINISGCAPRDRLGQGAVQEIDQVGMARTVTKGAWMVPDPHRIPDLVATAFRTALSGRRGPVHLTIPLDVQEIEVDESNVRFYSADEYRATGVPFGDPGSVRAAIELLHSAERPMIVASNGAYSVDPEELQRLIEITRIPIFTEEAARGIVSDDHPYCFGFADGRVNDAAAQIKDADVILLLGKKLDYTVNFGDPPVMDRDVRIVQVEPSAELIGLSRGVDVSIHGDVGAVVKQLIAEAEDRHWKDHSLLSQLESTQASQRRTLEERANAPSTLHAMSVHMALSQQLTEDTSLVFEGSDFAFFGAAYHPSLKPNHWFTNGTLGMIGWGVPYGIGLKVAAPQSSPVVLTGDGAFGFNAMEIDTAVRHNLNVVIVVGSDGVWGIDYHQQVQLYGRAAATELEPVRYDKMAEALGAHGEYVKEAGQLPSALERAFSSGKPAVVNIKTGPEASPLTEYIIRLKSGALDTK